MSEIDRRRGGAGRRRGGFTLRDLVVLVFLASVLAAAQAHVNQQAREQSSRIKCSSNLRQIGQAMLIYAAEHKGPFPRTVFDETANPVPTEYTGVGAPDPFGPGGPGPNDVTAPLFLLLRTMDVTADAFVCPSVTGRADVSPWPGNPGRASNFPSRVHLSYAYANPYPSRAALAVGFKFDYTLNSDFPVVADMGPAGAAADVPQSTPRAGMVAANSQNHGGDGQNVLFADGHVDWEPTPFAGPRRPAADVPRDNIYTYGANASPAALSAGSRGAPQDQHDAVLLPGSDAGAQPSRVTAAARRWQVLLLTLGGGGVAVMAVALVVILARQRRATPEG